MSRCQWNGSSSWTPRGQGASQEWGSMSPMFTASPAVTMRRRTLQATKAMATTAAVNRIWAGMRFNSRAGGRAFPARFRSLHRYPPPPRPDWPADVRLAAPRDSRELRDRYPRVDAEADPEGHRRGDAPHPQDRPRLRAERASPDRRTAGIPLPLAADLVRVVRVHAAAM